MAEGSFVHRVADLELGSAALDPETVLEGSPEVSELVFAVDATEEKAEGMIDKVLEEAHSVVLEPSR